jgi:EAL domain-containing protein (putative c-di-GMP-specific phosphodiesterase class I)
VAEDDAHVRSLARVTLSQELRAGVTGRQFVVAYQPIVRLDDGRIIGHEALVRWQHPTRGLLAPGAFLDVAEEYSGIMEIGHQVLEQVCRDLNGPLSTQLGTVSLNVSAVQLRHDDWVSSFLSVTDRLRVPLTRVTVEVTETAVIGDPAAAAAKLQLLRDRGFGVHVDDFGTGNSSISLLLDLPLTGLKLDSRFTWQLTDAGGPANTLSSSLAGLAHGLDLMAVAEGIETEGQRRILRQHGWVHGQGYLFGKPTLL